MYCRTCGKEIPQEAMLCMACGSPPGAGRNHCQNCGAPTQMIAEMCVACGVRLASGGAGGARSKLAAGLLGIFLGAFGIHRFYLGYTGIAVIQLVLGLLGFVTFFITSFASWVWGLIEGILILSGSINKDATGRPLRE